MRMTNDRLLWETAMGNKKRLDMLEKRIEELEKGKIPEKRKPGRPRTVNA